jgi:putative membrane protein
MISSSTRSPRSPSLTGSCPLSAIIFASLGLTATVWLILVTGLRGIENTLAIAGFSILWVVPLHIIPIMLDSQGWRVLLHDGDQKPSSGFLFWVAGIREAINGLLPVFRVGGEFTGARLATRAGISKANAIASVLVEVTLTLFNQVFFTLMGIFLLLTMSMHHPFYGQILPPLALGTAAILIFMLIQRGGLFAFCHRWIERMGGGNRFVRAVGDPQALDQAIRRLYQRRSLLLRAALWQMAGLLAGVLEIWLALFLLGSRVGWSGALILESLSQALRSMSFFVPSGIGVQEGGFVVFGSLLGIRPDITLSLSLVRRLREVLFGLPFLVSWQWLERRKWALGEASLPPPDPS